MKTVVITRSVDDDELALLREPRTAPAVERPRGDGVFELGAGPFWHYRRTLEVHDQPDADGRHTVVETTEFALAIPIWGGLFVPLMKRAIKHPPPPGTTPWWVPPDHMDARASEVLSLLCVFSLITGYLGVLLGQLNPYIKIEFGSQLSEIADVQIAVRVGAFLALVVVASADRVGRKRMLLLATYIGTGLAATGAFAPSLAWLGMSQGVARAFSAAIGLIVLVMAAEEMPAGARAFAVSVIAMTSALGAGGVVMFLGLADKEPWAWRVFFVAPLVFLIPTVRVGRRQPETKRFEVLERARVAEGDPTASASAGPMAGRRTERWQRFAMVGSVSLFFNIFLSPVGANLNEFLKTEQGFAGWQIAAFQVLTNLPGGIAIVVGGRLADRYGRRLIGSIGVIGGAGFNVLMFLGSGWSLWIFSTLGTLIGALVIPALGVYQSELFSTGSRGRANGGINLMAVTGAVIGLKATGVLAERLFDNHLGPAIAILGIGPLIVAAIVILFYPETVHKELEELNPEDLPPPEGAELVQLDAWHREHEADLHSRTRPDRRATHRADASTPGVETAGVETAGTVTGDGAEAAPGADADPTGPSGSITPRA